MKIFIFIILLLTQNSFASSCCGGGSSSSLIITGDNRQEMTLGFGLRNDLGSTDQTGWANFNNQSMLDKQTSFNFQIQRQFFDYTQIALKTSIIEKEIQKQNRREKNSGLADIDLQLSYEFLPEFTFSNYKPRGFIYSKITLPQSKGLYDSQSAIFSDVRGGGLYALSAGSFFIKKFSSTTLKAGFEVQHLFGKNYSTGKLNDYNKFILPMGLTYAFDPTPLSFGLNSTWNYQGSKKWESNSTNSLPNSASEYFWELGTFINWTYDKVTTYGLSYSDSTLMGKNINSALYRSFALNYTHSVEL